MNKIEIYTKNYCPYCARAKALLDSMELSYDEYELTFDPTGEAEMVERSGRITVPQIFVNDLSIGGSDELVELVENGQFAKLIHSSPIQSVSNLEVSSHV